MDVYFKLSTQHTRARVKALIEQGGECIQEMEKTPFATLFHARCAVLAHIYTSIGNLLDTEMLALEQFLHVTPSTLREQLRCRYMPPVHTSTMDRQVRMSRSAREGHPDVWVSEALWSATLDRDMLQTWMSSGQESVW